LTEPHLECLCVLPLPAGCQDALGPAVPAHDNKPLAEEKCAEDGS
jgi:hypothetical protein